MGTHPLRTGSSHGAGEKSSLVDSVGSSTNLLENVTDHFPLRSRTPYSNGPTLSPSTAAAKESAASLRSWPTSATAKSRSSEKRLSSPA